MASSVLEDAVLQRRSSLVRHWLARDTGIRVRSRSASAWVIQLSAVVKPLRRIQLAVRTESVLTAVLVAEDDELTAGQLVACIDVSEQRAELARATARLDEQRSAYARVEQLRTGQYIGRDQSATIRTHRQRRRSDDGRAASAARHGCQDTVVKAGL